MRPFRGRRWTEQDGPIWNQTSLFASPNDAFAPARLRIVQNRGAGDPTHDWLFSFLSPDKRKTYCLYEAPNAEAIRVAARRANIPADDVIEVSELKPEMFA
jgi:hypothetical protein